MRNTKFVALTASSAASKLGNAMLYLAVPLALISASGSAGLAVLSAGALNAPYVLAPFAGAIIDRFDRRRVYAAGEIAQAGLVIGILFALLGRHVALVYVLLLILGFGSVVSNLSSDFALLPRVLGSRDLQLGMGLYEGLMQAARMVGPVVGAVLYELSGVKVTLGIDAGTFFLTAAASRVVPREVREVGAERRASFRGGLAFLRKQRDLVQITFLLGCYNLGTGALVVAAVVEARTGWHWSTWTIGFISAAAGAGGATGSAIGARMWPSTPFTRRVSRWLLLSLVASVIMFIGPVGSFCGIVLLSLSASAINLLTTTRRVQLIPKELIGRVNSVIRMTAYCVIPLSSLAFGFTLSLGGGRVFLPCLLCCALAYGVWLAGSRGARPARARDGEVAVGAVSGREPNAQ